MEGFGGPCANPPYTLSPPPPTHTKTPKNTNKVYLQFYLLDTLGESDRALALVPLTLYLAGLGATFMTEWLNDRLGRKLTYLAGTCVDSVCMDCLCLFLTCVASFTTSAYLHHHHHVNRRTQHNTQTAHTHTGGTVVLLACAGFQMLSPAWSGLVYPLAVIMVRSVSM